MPDYLTKRDGKWSFKMRLPKDVSDFVKANPDFPKPKYWQKNIKQKALGTSDEELAKKKRNIELVVFQQEVDTFRKDIRGYVKLPATEDDILQLSLGEFQRLQDRDSKLQPGSPEEAKALINYTYMFGYHWGATNEGYYPNRAKELLGENGLTATDEQIDSFANLIRRAFMQQYQALKEKTTKPALPPFVDDIFAEKLPTGKGFKFGALLEEYVSSKQGDWRTSSNTQYSRSVENLRQIIGNDTDIRKVEPPDVIQWQDLILAIPKNRSKFKVLKGMSIHEQIKYGKQNNMTLRAAKTVNFDLDVLGAVFRLACDYWHIERDPTRVIKRVSDEVLAENKRDPFAMDQLRKLFIAPLYTGCQNDRNGWAKPGNNVIRRARFWAPLIALFSGLRLNEICQLWSDDIIEIDGKFYIRVCENYKRRQKLKTPSAARMAPIHSELIKMGIVELMDHNNPHHIFNELTYCEKKKNYSDTFSSWFRRFIDRSDAAAPRTSFHSFRHNFKKAVDTESVKDIFLFKIMGWAPENKSMKHQYGKIEPHELVTYVEAISYDLDLSNLYV